MIPFLEKEVIRRTADDLRVRHNRTRLPAEIESLIEDLGLRIHEIPGLRDRSLHDACIYRDWSVIAYDPAILERRLRFSLAHELAHYILHRELIDQLPDTHSTEEWRDLVLSLPEPFQQRLEWQAHYFASCALMPHAILLASFDAIVAQMRPLIHQVQVEGLRRHEYVEGVGERIAERIGNQFEVTTAAALTRMKEDALLEDIP